MISTANTEQIIGTESMGYNSGMPRLMTIQIIKVEIKYLFVMYDRKLIMFFKARSLALLRQD